MGALVVAVGSAVAVLGNGPWSASLAGSESLEVKSEGSEKE
jgi:hypothetical protein